MPSKFVIYKFTSPSGKSYIGQTNNIKRRIKEHKKANRCRAFNSAIKKHGFDNFTMSILKENLTIEEANFWEELYIKEFNSLSPNGYNLRTGGSNSVPSIETRKRMSAWQTGRKRPEIAEKLRVFNTGKKHTKESRIKMSASRIGKSATAETRAKMSLSQKGLKKNYSQSVRIEMSRRAIELFKGKQKTDDHKEKLSEAAKNRPPISEETRKKLSEAAKIASKNRPPVSDETRKKIAASKLGKKRPRNAIESMAESKMKAYLVTTPDNKKIIIKGMKRFCLENNLRSAGMFAVATGKIASYKGWKCEYFTQEKAAPLEVSAA